MTKAHAEALLKLIAELYMVMSREEPAMHDNGQVPVDVEMR